MQSILDSFKNAAKRIDRVNVRLDALKYLFQMEENKIEEVPGGVRINDNIDLLHLFQNENLTVTYVTYKKEQVYLPMHTHAGSIEYLIAAKGRFLMKFGTGYGTRIMQRGECASIPLDVEHTCIALEDGSELIAVCIPPEPAYEMGKPVERLWRK